MTDRGQRSIGLLPVYPFLFAAHPVLSLLLNNVSKVPLPDMVPPLLLIESGVLVVLLAARALCGSWRRAALHTLLIVLLILFLQRFEDGLVLVFRDGVNIWLLCGIWFLLLWWVWRLIRRHEGNLRATTLALNVGAVLFLAVPVLGVGWHSWQVSKVRSAAVEAVNRPVPELKLPAGGVAPDIWYIVLDRYARADVLKALYDFDNSEFLGRLSENGFQVLENSTANYQRTAHSLASSLNLDYLDAAAEVTGKRSPDWGLLYQLLEDNKVWRALKKVGYDYLHFGSWWSPTAANSFADRNFVWKVVPTFQRFLISQSLPGRLAGAAGLATLDERWLQCERVTSKFTELVKLATTGSDDPRFVFAHFLMPHPPYVVRSNGTCLTESVARQRSRRDNYIDQVKYTNHKLLALVSAIRRQQDRPAIIILQADEGPWPSRIAGDEHTVGMDTTPVKWKSLTDQELREKQAIFHAIYLPEGSKQILLPSTLTPVNTFRLIFRHWFNADQPALDDRNYIYLDNNHVLGFEDVTRRLR
jgi:hypothetical protein